MIKYLLVYLLLITTAFSATIIDIDETMPDPIIYIKYASGVEQCILFPTSTGTDFASTPMLEAETLEQYITRHLTTTDLTQISIDRCAILQDKYLDIWLVQQWRSYLTRPLYNTELFLTGSRKEIGRVPYDTVCGKVVQAKTNNVSWREVSINNLTGTAICKRQ